VLGHKRAVRVHRPFGDPRTPAREQDRGRLRLGLAQTPPEIANPHPRIDQHQHRPELEQRERQLKKLQTGRHHQDGPHAASDAEPIKLPRDGITRPIEARKRMPPPARVDDGQPIRIALRHCRRSFADTFTQSQALCSPTPRGKTV